MFDNVRADLERARQVNGLAPGWFSVWIRTPMHLGVMAVLMYRLDAWVHQRLRLPGLRQAALIVVAILRRVMFIVTGVEISPYAEIGPGLVVHTTHGVFIAATRIGRNCLVQHGVLIMDGVRSVGDNVYFGPGAKVIGQPMIGHNVRVVANSVVMTDVADNLTVIGVPARIRWRNRSKLATSAVVAVALLPAFHGDLAQLMSLLRLM
jgi:serine O-acetyltransferase